MFPIPYSVPFPIPYLGLGPHHQHHKTPTDNNKSASDAATEDIENKYKAAVEKSGVSHIHYDSDKYQVSLDVSHFKPEELSVKLDDNCIVLEGHHDETQDEHGYVTRSFKRRYILPPDISPETLKASISSDGVLHLEAPRPKHEPLIEKLIPIAVEQENGVFGGKK